MINNFMNTLKKALVDCLGIEDFDANNTTITIKGETHGFKSLYSIAETLEKTLIGYDEECLNLLGEDIEEESVKSILVLPTPDCNKLTDGLILIYINNKLKAKIEIPNIFGTAKSNTKMKNEFKSELKGYKTYGFLKASTTEKVSDFLMKNLADEEDEDCSYCCVGDFLDDCMDLTFNLGAYLASMGDRYLSACLNRGKFECHVKAVFIDKNTLEILEDADVA